MNSRKAGVFEVQLHLPHHLDPTLKGKGSGGGGGIGGGGGGGGATGSHGKCEADGADASALQRAFDVQSASPAPADASALASSRKPSSTRFSVEPAAALTSSRKLSSAHLSAEPAAALTSPQLLRYAALDEGAEGGEEGAEGRAPRRRMRASAARNAQTLRDLVQEEEDDDDADVDTWGIPTRMNATFGHAATALARGGRRAAAAAIAQSEDDEPDKPAGRARNKRGRQVYLGVYRSEERGARAYDRASIKFLGSQARLNVRFIRHPDTFLLRVLLQRQIIAGAWAFVLACVPLSDSHATNRNIHFALQQRDKHKAPCVQFPRSNYAGADEAAQRAQLSYEQYVALLKRGERRAAQCERLSRCRPAPERPLPGAQVAPAGAFPSGPNGLSINAGFL